MKKILKILGWITFFIMWTFIHVFIHELGHAIACVLTGGEFCGFGIDLTRGVAYTLCRPATVESIPIIAAAGVLSTIISTTTLSLCTKRIFTSMTNTISFTGDGIYWCLGGFYSGSDTVLFAKAINVEPILFGLFFLPVYVVGLYLTYKKFNKEVERNLNG